MGTIFVAYGEESHRERVLEFAAERADASGDDLFVYHIHDTAETSEQRIHDEIGSVIERTAPGIEFEVQIGPRDRLEADEAAYERTKVSKRKQLLDAIVESDREYEYIVMGNVDHGPVEEFVLPSMTEAVLETNAAPVALVPAPEG